MNSTLKHIVLCAYAGEQLHQTASAELVAGKGLVGDRYYLGTGAFSQKFADKPDGEVTLIEQEEIDAFNQVTGRALTGKDFRRNLITRGVRLNKLVGRQFRVGGVVLQGVRLCEPCARLVTFLGEEVMQHTLHKAGLRAGIVRGGVVHTGDVVAPVQR